MTMRECLLASMLLAAVPPAQAEELVERWLFLGRRTESGWNPPAVSVANPPYPAKAGAGVVVRRHALAYGSVDCKISDAADFQANEQVGAAVELVRAGEQALEIAGAPIECPSVCGAKTVWIKVKVPAARLVTIEP